MRCPNCGARQQWRDIRSFRAVFCCPTCGTTLRVPESYTTRNTIAILIVTAAITYASGARGYRLILLPIVLYVVSGFVIVTVARYVFPPHLEVVELNCD